MSVIRFEGRVALVTGAGRGLGAAYARALAARAAQVVVHDAGVQSDGNGFDPAVAEGIVDELEGAGGTAVACHENLESEAGCRRTVELEMIAERWAEIEGVVTA